jgi:hypothetical protein
VPHYSIHPRTTPTLTATTFPALSPSITSNSTHRQPVPPPQTTHYRRYAVQPWTHIHLPSRTSFPRTHVLIPWHHHASIQPIDTSIHSITTLPSSPSTPSSNPFAPRSTPPSYPSTPPSSLSTPPSNPFTPPPPPRPTHPSPKPQNHTIQLPMHLHTLSLQHVERSNTLLATHACRRASEPRSRGVSTL